MRRSADSLIEFIQFAGVAVAFIGVVVAVGRAALGSLVADRRRRMTTISLDLARTVLIGLDLLLVAAALEVAVATVPAGGPDFTRLATVVGLRIGLSLLIAFELAFRAGTDDPELRSEAASRAAPPWEAALRRRFGRAVPPRRRPAAESPARSRAHPSRPHPPIRPARTDRPVTADWPIRERRLPAENLWPERARLGRD